MSLPTLFISHGSPMEALDAGAAGQAWRLLGQTLPTPAAIVVVSAHFDTPVPVFGTAERPATVHDFYGFPEALYRLSYPAPGAPALAETLAQGLREQGWEARTAEQGLDHGAWVPLRYLYPDARIPVVPLSMSADRGPDYHFALGQALAPLLPADTLLIGSGSLTHNLGDFRRGGSDAPDYVTAFQAWIQERLRERDLEALLDYRRRAPHARQAHPTDEHLLPLFVALGAAAAEGEFRIHHDGIAHRVLAMDVYGFSRREPVQCLAS
ncbi:DODA-type extradiol aromatic ring-opening family dioxygenase [Pseudomonas sp. EpS/L25]|uniref:DODA-type extradiol aromatic ring-opening family dioxygenase n=1 Tax=Pseudomonas sp. EpS/L25 TaxID=1749078 RepID=UPI000743F3CB|nr:class III extradiol ring-cleavage dioxygenase [Pseudomonas sp. EpS/L25]KUM44493.1 dioxygenase [Pseudomonas sp. EpS/L25]